MRCPLRKKGLTLIELLVVIGITITLVGIIWIVIASIMEKARQASCMNNLKQIGLAIAIYRQDYNGSLIVGQPFWKLGLPPDLSTLYFSGYIKNRKIFFCPNRHYSTPILNNLTIISYIIANSERCAHLPPPRSFSYWSLVWGEEYPLIWDVFHTYRYWEKTKPRFQIELTLGGKVRSRWVTYTLKYWWLGPPPSMKGGK